MKNELIDLVKSLYEEMRCPFVLTDADMYICWANPEALRRYPSFSLPDGMLDLFANYDLAALRKKLHAGAPVVLDRHSEPFNMLSVRVVPVLEEGALAACQMFLQSGEEGGSFAEESPEDTIAAFSNEYRAPLTVIFSTLGLMARHLDDVGDEISRAYLKLITQNAYRLLRLSNNLVEVSRFRSGITQPAFKTGDLCKFLREICDASDILTRSIGIPLTCTVPEKPLFTIFDPNKLALALFNLISNSCKFSREGNHIRVRLEEQGNKAVVSVTDKGEGISPQIIDHIFEPYFSHWSENNVAGAGLGLSIVRQVAVEHHGTIAVHSREGDGTTVAFTLPIRSDENLPNYIAENGADYFADRFSMLYVELSDVCGCPLP